MKDSRRKYRHKKADSYCIALMVVQITIERKKEALAYAETEEEAEEITKKLEDLENFKRYLKMEIEKYEGRTNE